MKHGAIGRQGAIDITWVLEGGDVRFVWDETLLAATPNDPDRPAGFGGQLVKLSAMQLGGTHEQARRPGGLRLTLRFPAQS